MIGYDIAAHGTVLWLEQYDKATYRVRYNNTPGSFGYQRVVGYNSARSTTTITFLSSIPLHNMLTLQMLIGSVENATVCLDKLECFMHVRPFPFFFVYCRMRFLILGRSVAKEKKRNKKKKIEKESYI